MENHMVIGNCFDCMNTGLTHDEDGVFTCHCSFGQRLDRECNPQEQNFSVGDFVKDKFDQTGIVTDDRMVNGMITVQFDILKLCKRPDELTPYDPCDHPSTEDLLP